MEEIQSQLLVVRIAKKLLQEKKLKKLKRREINKVDMEIEDKKVEKWLKDLHEKRVLLLESLCEDKLHSNRVILYTVFQLRNITKSINFLEELKKETKNG